MPVITDVNLPKSLTPKFPDRCIVCGTEKPGGTFRASTYAIGWWSIAMVIPGWRFTADVPACETCRWTLTRQKWIRLLVNTICIIAAVGVALFILQGVQGRFKRWLAVGIALVCLIPLFLWETFFPKPFDMTAYSESVDYEFQDSDYAAEFAALNQRALENE